MTLPRWIEPLESVGLGMPVVAGSPPTAGRPVSGIDRVELPPCIGLVPDVECPGCTVLPRWIEPLESVGLGMPVVAGSPPTAGRPVSGIDRVELPPCIELPLWCMLLELPVELLPGLVVAGERGMLLRSFDCEGLGVRFAGALGSVLGAVGSELGVDCVVLPPCIVLPIEPPLPGLVVMGERGTLLRSFDCEGLGVMFAGAFGLVLGTVGSELGADCVELPLCLEPLVVEPLIEPLGLGMLVVEGSPPVAGTLVELGELTTGAALLG